MRATTWTRDPFDRRSTAQVATLRRQRRGHQAPAALERLVVFDSAAQRTLLLCLRRLPPHGARRR